MQEWDDAVRNENITSKEKMGWDHTCIRNEKITCHLYSENATAKLGYLCHKFWKDNANYVENLT